MKKSKWDSARGPASSLRTIKTISMDSALHPDLSAGVNAFRGALTEMLTEVGADIARPQEVSRKLKLDKSLAWKLSRVVGAVETHDALQYLPGDAAIQIVIRAVERAGGSLDRRNRIESAWVSLLDCVRRRIGDKGTLELVVDALPDETGERLVASRKLAFRGNSAIWGVQARARIHTMLLRPNNDKPDLIDVAMIAGWVDFRRVRHDARWTLFRRSSLSMDGAPPPEEPIDKRAATDHLLRLSEFCSDNMPPVYTHEEDGVQLDELGESGVGNSGQFTCMFGSVVRALGSRYGEPGVEATFPVQLSAPTEHLQYDMLVHRDCKFAMKQTVKTISKLTVQPMSARDVDVLPIRVARRDLGREPPAVPSYLMPRYADMIRWCADALGWDLGEFVGTRYSVEYPPFPASVVVSCPLEQKA